MSAIAPRTPPSKSTGVSQFAAQLVGPLAAWAELVCDCCSERLGEPLLEQAQLLAQPVVLRLGVGQVGAQRRDGDLAIGDRGRSGAPSRPISHDPARPAAS